MRDKVAKWVYLTIKRRGSICQLLMGFYYHQRWGAGRVTRALVWTTNIIPDLHNRGQRLWSKEKFDEQLRRDGP